MKLTRNRILAGALVIVIVAAVALAQGMGRHSRMCHGFGFDGHMLGFFSTYLDLTDAQQTQIKQILEKEKPTIQPLLQQIGQGHEQLRQLEQSDTFDENKVRQLVAQNQQALTELIVQKARIHSELYQVLTPQQKAKFNQFMQNKHEHFQKWMDGTVSPQS